MGSFSTTALNGMLDTELATVYIQLHTGDPGASGTSNVASNSTRKSLSLGSASAGVKTQSGDLTWTSVPAAETYSWVSAWSASSSGTFYGRAQLTASSTVAIGNTFTLPSPNLTFTLS